MRTERVSAHISRAVCARAESPANGHTMRRKFALFLSYYTHSDFTSRGRKASLARTHVSEGYRRPRSREERTKPTIKTLYAVPTMGSVFPPASLSRIALLSFIVS